MTRIAMTLSLLAGLALAAPASAQDRSAIIDEAGMFSKDAIRLAQSELAEIDRAYKLAVTVETIDSLKGQTINEATERRAEQLDHKGIFILIANKDHRAQAIASRNFRDKLTVEKMIAIRDAFTDQFRAGKADEGLIRGVHAAATTIIEVMPKPSGSKPERSFEPAPAAAAAPIIGRGPSPLVDESRVGLTLAGARKALDAAEAKAVSLKLKSNIAVVDDGGHLLAFARMDGSRPASVATSITKATTAATFRQASGPLPVGGSPDLLLNLGIQDAAAASGGKFTSLRGGLPITVDGQVIGAIGVAGGNSEQDVEVATAGVDAFLAELKGTAKPAASDPAKPEPVGDFSTPKPR
ncbi:heme-binding protein [Tundrisphaera sp. TA3]|uniref:heme-binding protein n=1 Tax=Tundrisphaera sp. TA3 TaxID=3435775 RepID=UPI003EBA0893